MPVHCCPLSGYGLVTHGVMHSMHRAGLPLSGKPTEPPRLWSELPLGHLRSNHPWDTCGVPNPRIHSPSVERPSHLQTTAYRCTLRIGHLLIMLGLQGHLSLGPPLRAFGYVQHQDGCSLTSTRHDRFERPSSLLPGRSPQNHTSAYPLPGNRLEF